MRVGIIGCGGVSGVYLANLRGFADLSLEACADIVPERAVARAAEFGVAASCGVEELLASPSIDLVVNLTPPHAHYDVTRAILRAGKHAYSEKPLAATFAEGYELVQTARARGRALGCAPDTFLGAGVQTCIGLVDDGAIGDPIGAVAFQMRAPPESGPAYVPFAYERGGGPLFDMGPYYLTALVAMLGPVRRVFASAKVSWPDRVVAAPPDAGTRLRVETPTWAAGTLDFRSGVVGTFVTTYDVWASTLPNIEIYGRRGTLRVPDPNCFGGPVALRRAADEAWMPIPLRGRWRDNCRGVGIADMVEAMERRQPHRASAELALHVLEIMQGFLESSRSGTAYTMTGTCDRPARSEREER